MAFIRPVIILLIFFGLLFAFRVPVAQTVPNIQQSVVQPLLNFFDSLKNATTSVPAYGVLKGTPAASEGSVSSASSSIASQVGVVQTRPSVDKLPPVKSNPSSDQHTTLSASGIIKLTNSERAKKGLAPLTENKTLDTSAMSKVEDMFTNQYFEHVSPSGASVSGVVNKAGYQYIVVGENLALGNFGGDAQVVAAWMASPGHRANILDARYQDIGVAVGQGMYNGKQQWLAVQHFGKPLSACPAVDSQLKSSIDSTEQDLKTREARLAELKKQIDSTDQSSQTYKAMVDEYNAEVQEYDRRLESFKTAVDQYNGSVKDFNTCAGLTT